MRRIRPLSLAGWALALLAPLSQAATLSGEVKDPSGKPLPNVQVVIPALRKGVRTDGAGDYKVEDVPPGNYAVEFRPVGYPPVTKNANLSEGDATLDVAVTGSPLALVPITISAAPKPQSTLTTPASVSVMQGRELQKSRDQSVMTAIQNEPGVSMVDEGPTVVKPVINGLNSQNIVIAEDGLREDFIQWGNEHAPEISAAGVDRIEVLRGANSLMYGSDAIGGVISVSHPELPNAGLGAGPLSGKIDLDAHSVNSSVGENVMLQGAQGDWGWRGNLNQQQAQNFQTGNQGTIPNTGENEASGSGAIGVRKSWGDLSLDYSHFYKDVQLQNGFVYPQPLLDTEYQVLRHDHAVAHADVLSGAGRLELFAGYDRSNRQEFNGTADSNGIAQGSAGDLGSYWIETTYTGEARMHLNPMGPFNGTLGVSALRRVEEQLTPDAHLTPGYNENGVGEYLYEEAPVGDFTFSFGVRGDQDHYSIDNDALVGADAIGNDPTPTGVAGQSLNYSAVTGAAGGVYHITEPLAFAVNAGRGYRNPVPFELFADGVHEGAGVFQVGNSSLKPEQSLDTDAELRWSSDRLKGEIGVFRNYIQDYIYGAYTGAWVTDPEAANPTLAGCAPGVAGCLPLVHEQQSNATIQGVSYSVNAAATDWLTVTSGGNLVRGYNDAYGPVQTTPWIPEVPADTIRIGAEVHRKKLWDVLYNPYFGLEEKLTNAQMRAAPFEIQTPGYALLDAKLGTEFLVLGDRISVDGGVKNLLNKGYIDFDSILKEFNIENPGRDVFVNVSVPFGS